MAEERSNMAVDRKCVQKTLQESLIILSVNLNPKELLRKMKAKNALTSDEVTIINNEITVSDKVDKLIETLKRKPVTSYQVFMELLKEDRSDLYQNVKTIEAKHIGQNALPSERYPQSFSMQLPSSTSAWQQPMTPWLQQAGHSSDPVLPSERNPQSFNMQLPSISSTSAWQQPMTPWLQQAGHSSALPSERNPQSFNMQLPSISSTSAWQQPMAPWLQQAGHSSALPSERNPQSFNMQLPSISSTSACQQPMAPWLQQAGHNSALPSERNPQSFNMQLPSKSSTSAWQQPMTPWLQQAGHSSALPSERNPQSFNMQLPSISSTSPCQQPMTPWLQQAGHSSALPSEINPQSYMQLPSIASTSLCQQPMTPWLQQAGHSSDPVLPSERNRQSLTMQLPSIASTPACQPSRSDVPDFNLESVRRQLSQEYLETRSTLPLLPGMPEEFAKMEDIFVDLDIVEEDKKPSGVISKILESYGDLVCIKRKVCEHCEGKDCKKCKFEPVNRILVRGGPGAGKSSTISKLAYDWACGRQDSPISRVQLLFALTINKIDNKDLTSAIQDQLLPKVPKEVLEACIQSQASSVAILLDGYDEASEQFHQSKDIKNVLCSKWLAEACVIVTTRPNQVGKFSQNYGTYLQVEIQGFSSYNQEKYVQKFLKFYENRQIDDINMAQSDSCSKFLISQNKSAWLHQLSSIPIILSMLCLLWVDDKKLPSTITVLYKEVIIHLAKHAFAKTATDDLDMSNIQNWSERVLDHIGNVAIDGLFKDRLVFKPNEFESAALEEACLFGVVTKEKKRSKLNVTYNVTFLHKTFQEISAAYYWVEMIETEMDRFTSYLNQVTSENIFTMEYLLRFACGLSVKAAEIILPHVVCIMCQYYEYNQNDYEQFEEDIYNTFSIYENKYQQMPIFLLFETESNNSQIGFCSELHKLMAPLFERVHIGESNGRMNTYFEEILNLYIHSQQGVSDSNACKQMWLNDVVEVEVNSNLDERSVELLCAMSEISNLAFDYYARDITDTLNLLLSKQYHTPSLSKLNFRNFKCDANVFSQFLSSIPSVTKLKLKMVYLHGKVHSCSGGASFLPALKELHLDMVDDDEYMCYQSIFGAIELDDMNDGDDDGDTIHVLDVFMRNQFSASLTELHFVGVKCDANVFSQFLSSIPSVTELTLIRVYLHGKVHSCSGSTSFLPALKVLHLDHVGHDEATIHVLDVFIMNQFSASLNGLYLSDVKCDANVFSQFLSGIKSSICKLELWHVVLQGELSCPLILPAVKELECIGSSSVACIAISQVADQIEQQNMSQSHSSQESNGENKCILTESLECSIKPDDVCYLAKALQYMFHLRNLVLAFNSLTPRDWDMLFDALLALYKNISNHENKCSSDGECDRNGLLLERLDLACSNVGESMATLAKVYRYMPHLRYLNLSYADLNSHQCDKLFDGFIEAGQASDDDSLAVEELVMSKNDIGDSAEKLAQAYRYMTHVRCLYICDTKLNPSVCAVLFDGFITAGKMLTQQDETSSNTQADIPSTSQAESVNQPRSKIGLPLEKLDMGRNDIGDSVGKLAQAYRYMKHLRCLYIHDTKLNPSQCAVLFDGFITAGKMLSQDSTPSMSQGLCLEDVYLSYNEIGDSGDRLIQALKYMPHLEMLEVSNCGLKNETKQALRTMNFNKNSNLHVIT